MNFDDVDIEVARAKMLSFCCYTLNKILRCAWDHFVLILFLHKILELDADESNKNNVIKIDEMCGKIKS